MQTVALSESAVAVLRLRVRGHKMPVTEQRRAAYLELVAAGIMAPDGEEFRFTDDGWARRDQILDVEQDRIERERYAPPQGQLSRKAKRLLRECVERGIPIGDRWNRPAFRELVKARVMVPCGSFTLGDECVFRWTYWGHRMRFELAEIAHSEDATR